MATVIDSLEKGFYNIGACIVMFQVSGKTQFHVKANKIAPVKIIFSFYRYKGFMKDCPDGKLTLEVRMLEYN